MGSYGAVAEFFQDADEALDRNANDELVQITPRGGIRLEANDDLGICAYKITGSDGNSQQHIALCLPEELSRMSANDVLTELGPDCAALSDDACDDTLFDLGVSSVGSGAFQLDFCIRSGDAGLIDFLRDHCGSSIFEHGSPVFGRLMEAQPHRVAVTRLGRIEVYQEIGGEQSDDKTPEPLPLRPRTRTVIFHFRSSA